LILFELAYSRLHRFQDGCEERDRMFPSFRRRDVKQWSRLSMYPGAFLMTTPKMIAMFGGMGILIVFMCIAFAGRARDVPPTKWRYHLIANSYKIYSHVLMACQGLFLRNVVHGVDDVDYSKYLGPDWKNNLFTGKRVSMSISNHFSYLDGPVLVADRTLPYVCPQFTPADQIGKIPIARFILECCGAFFMPRAAGKEERDKIVEYVANRQKMIEESELDYPPIHIFPESINSNGLYMHRFRRGAFTSLRPIKPMLMEFKWQTMCPAYDSAKFFVQIVLCASQFRLLPVTIHTYPVFVPNEYMFTQYKRTLPQG
jgi:1-acyl-sn-glycerol-3-phosphate acyltransferase